MRVLIPAIGTRGDVQPLIALAQGLVRAGHTVTLMSHPHMRSLVEYYAVPFAPLGPDINVAHEAAALRLQSAHALVGLVRVMRLAFDILEQSHQAILSRCRDSDLVVFSSQSAAGRNEADLLGLPHVSMNLMPWGLPVNDPSRPVIKQIAYAAAGRMIGLITTRPLNRIRRGQGLPPVGPDGFTSRRLNLVPISPRVYPPDPHWEPHHRVVGYWFVKEPNGWKPPSNLLAFLEEGTPPLVVSLGAMGLCGGEDMETAMLFVHAVQKAGVRAVVQGWDTAVQRIDLPSSIYAAGSMPHSWLLPRAAGLVHHGGFGTTAAGFRAGIPQLVIPHLVDQFYWGKRVEELGVGLPAIPRKKLDTAGLAASLESLTHNDARRVTASRLADEIQSENGIDEAARLIEESMDQSIAVT
jgi:sterol 3beta-glucosyltransferase